MSRRYSRHSACILVEEYPASLQIRDHTGTSVIHKACRINSSLFKIRILVEHDTAALRAVDHFGALPIHALFQNNSTPSLSLIHYLVAQYPVSLQIPDRAGSLVLHEACRSNASVESIHVLVERHPAALRIRDNSGALPIHVLFQNNPSPALGTIKLLIQGFSGSVDAPPPTGAGNLLTFVCETATLDVLLELSLASPQLILNPKPRTTWSISKFLAASKQATSQK